jgi:glycosyltransferase involved in cell wall biosynthesis
MKIGQMPARIVQIDLAQPLPGVRAARGEDTFWMLIRRGAVPIGWIRCDAQKFGGHVGPDILAQLIAEKLAGAIVPIAPSGANSQQPFVSIIICHQGTSSQLQRTLQSIADSRYRNYEAIVVGSAGGDAEAKSLCAAFPFARHMLDRRTATASARNTALQIARGEIIAFVGEGVCVDSHWLSALVANFTDPSVHGVSGPSFPMELNTPAQRTLCGELEGELNRRVFKPSPTGIVALASAQFVTGSHLAIRRTTLQRLAGFDPTLGAGAEIDAMVRLLRDGGTLIYDPLAICWQQHTRSGKKLRQQLADRGRAVMTCCAKHARSCEPGNVAFKMAYRWLRRRGIDRLQTNLRLALRGKSHYPINLIVRELAGGFAGLQASRKQKRRVPSTGGVRWQIENLNLLEPWPLLSLKDGYHTICLRVWLGSVPVGEVLLRPRRGRMIPHARIARQIKRHCLDTILQTIARQDLNLDTSANLLDPTGLARPLRQRILEAQNQITWDLPPVTIALCTRDHQAALEATVTHLQRLDYPIFDILIVDNSRDPVPARELAARVNATYIRCGVGGLDRARNLAIEHATHGWIAFIDDQCRPETNWLKELVRPTQDTNCRCVAGLVLPAQLENGATITYEAHRAPARQFIGRIYDKRFLSARIAHPAATWKIGSAANLLIHRHFALHTGGFDASLGSAFDADFIRRVLRAHHNVHYTPRAIIHHGRSFSPRSLRNRVHADASSLAAYHARSTVRYRDYRSLVELLWHLPRRSALNLWRGVTGTSAFPLSLMPLETRGSLTGAFRYAAIKLRGWTKAFPLIRASTIAPAPTPVTVKRAAFAAPTDSTVFDPRPNRTSSRAA